MRKENTELTEYENEEEKEPFYKREGFMVLAGAIAVVVCCVCVFLDLSKGIAESNFSIEETEIYKNFSSQFGVIKSAVDIVQEKVVPTLSEEMIKENLDGVSETEQTSGFEESTVVRVKGGDTYVLNINGTETPVRLIGVDTPENVKPSDYSKENVEGGKEISEIIKEKVLEGTVLFVEYDAVRTDKFGRALAYLYFDNGEMVQEWLLKNGYAQCMTVQPNCKYADKFEELQRKAAENKIGFWNGYFKD